MMKKKIVRNRNLKIVYVLLALMVLLIFIGCVDNKDEVRTQEQNAFYTSWMSYVKDDIYVKDIVIPGSHDAGTIGMIYAARTQSESIGKQLEDGVRYFDIRVEKKRNAELVIYHSIAKGQSFTVVCDEILHFMETNSTELLILDFQHFKNNSMPDVANILESRLGQYFISNDSDKSDLDFVDTLKMGDCRGKILVCWGSDEKADVDWIFRRNNDNGSIENTVLDSYYVSSYHKMDSKEFIDTAYPDYYQRYTQKGKGLFVLQGQLTAKFILGSPKQREQEHNQNMNEFTKSLKENPIWLSHTNIIMRDFVNEKNHEDKIDLILALNVYKQNIKDAPYFLSIIGASE